MTPSQEARVRALLLALRPATVHHGDCVGSDARFHAICREALGDAVRIVVHPPENPALRAFMPGDEVPPAALHRAGRRHHRRVQHDHRHARKAGRDVRIVAP